MKLSKGRLLRLAANRCGLSGNMGLTIISNAVAKSVGAEAPERKSQRWELLLTFVGKAPADPSEKRGKSSRLVIRAPIPAVTTDEFLTSYEWRKLRMVVLKKHGATCQCCGATRADGVRIHVDHIKPRRLFPELALVESNLQVLCEECNHGKGNWDTTDWRGVA